MSKKEITNAIKEAKKQTPKIVATEKPITSSPDVSPKKRKRKSNFLSGSDADIDDSDKDDDYRQPSNVTISSDEFLNSNDEPKRKNKKRIPKQKSKPAASPKKKKGKATSKMPAKSSATASKPRSPQASPPPTTSTTADEQVRLDYKIAKKVLE